MQANDKKEKVEEMMEYQKGFFNPQKSPRKDVDFQFNFNEPEGVFSYVLSIKNKTCELHEGTSEKPICEINTDLETWLAVGNEYISPMEALKSGRFSITGNKLFFIMKFKKMFGGYLQWNNPGNVYTNEPDIKEIKKVLVVSSSHRIEKGATHFFVDKMIQGMKRAGASVDVLFPAKMNIKPCTSCFHCWTDTSRECIHHGKDDMVQFWELFHAADLVLWATPIYLYHCTSALKTLMDRLFLDVDPHLTLLDNNLICHPLKKERRPLEALMAVAALTDRDVFKPLSGTFNAYVGRRNSTLATEIFRTASVPFLMENFLTKKSEVVFKAFEQAGFELVQNKKVSKKTKKACEMELRTRSIFIAAANGFVERMLTGKEKVPVRKE